MNKTILNFFVFLFITIYTPCLYAQPGIHVLETVPKDSLGFYVQQQVERMHAHPEYSADMRWHMPSILRTEISRV